MVTNGGSVPAFGNNQHLTRYPLGQGACRRRVVDVALPPGTRFLGVFVDERQNVILESLTPSVVVLTPDAQVYYRVYLMGNDEDLPPTAAHGQYVGHATTTSDDDATRYDFAVFVAPYATVGA